MNLSGYMFMLAGMGALLVTSIPEAFAMPDVTPGCVPGVIFEGQFCIVKITANNNARGDETAVYDQEANPDLDDTCTNGLPNADLTVNVWLAVSDNLAEIPIRYYTPQLTSVFFPFNDGAGLIATNDGTSKLTSDGSDPSTISGQNSVNFKWKNLNFPLVKPKTDTRPAPSLLNILSCGDEGSMFQLDYQSRGFFETVVPVGGEILPINSAALLIAGISTSAIWIFPTVGTIVGTGIALYKLRKNI